MQVSSSIQTQYISSVSKTPNEESPYKEVSQKKKLTRHEELLAMNYDNMSEAERRELSYWHGMRSVSFLDEEGNKALNKALEGKTDVEKSQIKSVLELSFMTSIKVNNTNQTVDREKFDSIDTSKSTTIDRFEKFIVDFETSGDEDNIGLIDTINKFLNIYKDDSSLAEIKNQEDSVIDDFLEELYNTNSIESASALVKEDMKSKVDEYAQTLDKELNDSQKSEMINEYKQELLKEYKDILESSSDEKMTLKQQGIMKALLDENTKEASSLESLLSQKNNSTQSKDLTNNGANYYMKSLDAKGNEIMNSILSGRSDTEKFAIKGVLDRILSIKVNMNTDGSASISTQKFINKNTVLSNLDEYISNVKKSSDKYGILEVAIEFKSQYEALI